MAKNKKERIPKIRNNNTMTEAAFWSWIRSGLRSKSRFWKPITEAKKSVRKQYIGENKRQKWQYQCAICKEWFADKEIEVDHIIPAGSLRSSNDLKGFVERLFCEVDGLRVLCIKCHRNVTQNSKNAEN